MQTRANKIDVSPERINRLLKHLPPFRHDVVTPDDIDRFDRKGKIGWSYVTE